VDVILDGEMISWDNRRNEHIPFGSNKTVAKARRGHMQQQHTLEDCDLHLHEGNNNNGADDDDELNIAHEAAATSSASSTISSNRTTSMGAHCWLKYVAFDILYCGGPDAPKLLERVHRRMGRHVSGSGGGSGSLLHLDAYTRKMLLYELVDPQPNEVVLVDAMVICPDGSTVQGQDYFARDLYSSTTGDNDCHHDLQCCPMLDSIHNVRAQVVPNRMELDKKLRQVTVRSSSSSGNGNHIITHKDKDIFIKRAVALEQFYFKIVEQMCQEGILVKDLAAPYILGQASSRSLGYWRKLKADYEVTGHAADIDVVGELLTYLRRA
jgi:hypothetical protein